MFALGMHSLSEDSESLPSFGQTTSVGQEMLRERPRNMPAFLNAQLLLSSDDDKSCRSCDACLGCKIDEERSDETLLLYLGRPPIYNVKVSRQEWFESSLCCDM